MLVRKISVACLALALMASYAAVTPAAAEESDAMSQQRRLKAEQEKRTDEAYRRSLRNIDDKQTKFDPWGDVRATDQAATGKKK